MPLHEILSSLRLHCASTSAVWCLLPLAEDTIQHMRLALHTGRKREQTMPRPESDTSLQTRPEKMGRRTLSDSQAPASTGTFCASMLVSKLDTSWMITPRRTWMIGWRLPTLTDCLTSRLTCTCAFLYAADQLPNLPSLQAQAGAKVQCIVAWEPLRASYRGACRLDRLDLILKPDMKLTCACLESWQKLCVQCQCDKAPVKQMS